jgi:RimJ/RimL family protein N-acetyltransferase
MRAIKNNLIHIRNFRKSDIKKKFIMGLNDEKLNKFISTRKKKQSYKDALNYYISSKKDKFFYLAVLNVKDNNLIGTITYRKKDQDSFFLGYMVNDFKYIGGQTFFKAVKLSINHLCKTYKIKKILAATDKRNLPSNFFLIKLGFTILEKNKKTFKFLKKIK